MDVLSTAERAVYESLNIPMAIYDYVDGKVVTILVSDGLCAMKQMERDDLTRRFSALILNYSPQSGE